MIENWHLDERRAPPLLEGDALLYDEPGRIMDKTDYRSHWFRVVKPEYGQYTLLVRHGGGDERMTLAYSRRVAEALAVLDSDNRYYLLHTFHKVRQDAESRAAQEASNRYRAAFAEGRLRKRKMPGRNAHKVWIESVVALALIFATSTAHAQGFVYQSGPMGTPPAMSGAPAPYMAQPWNRQQAQPYTMPAPQPLPALPNYGRSYVPQPPGWRNP